VRDDRERNFAKLRHEHERLVSVAEGAKALQAAAERAQRRQGQFLAMAAHELRNPLMPIRNAAVMLRHARSDELPKVQGIIERQVAHMSRLVGDLLDVSRAETGKLTLEHRVIDVADAIDAAVDACRPSMEVRRQHLGVQRPSQPLDVHADPVRLTQILINLLENASRYTPDLGSISLSVESADDSVEVAVADTGIGFTGGALTRILDPFTQSPNVVSMGGGLGIGLTLVKELVAAHGWSVTATSEGAGRGSRFVVKIPLVHPIAERRR